MKPTDLRPLPDHYIALGPILKSYGTMGDFIVDSFPETALDDYIFIEIEGIKVPFEIEELVDRSGQVVVKVSGVDDMETAELYRGCPTFAAPSDQHDLTQDQGESYQSLIGWRVYSSDDDSYLGVVERYDDNTANVLLCVRSDDEKEHLLPWVTEWIETLDEAHHILRLTLPEGLLE